MKPSMIKALGFQFHGGNEDGCIFALYPQSLQDTVDMINEAKDFLRDSGSKWAEMTMLSRDGQKEIVSLYLEQDKAESVKVADFEDTIIEERSVKVNDLDDDPYSWSYGH